VTTNNSAPAAAAPAASAGGSASAERLFAQIFRRLTMEWNRISNFREVSQLGLHEATQKLYERNAEIIRHSLSDPEMRKLFTDPDAFISEGHAAAAPRELTRKAAGDFTSSVDAASLVFAHSLLDSSLQDCCRLCAILAPSDWVPTIRDRKTSIGQIIDTSVKDVIDELISADLERLERESLLKKSDRMFSLCPPPAGFVAIQGFNFDRARLLALDELRHNAVHSNDQHKFLPNGEDDLLFLQRSGLYVWRLINAKHGIRLYSEDVFGSGSNR